LRGQLEIVSREPQGTRVQLEFQPEFLGKQTEGSVT
jgi:two-component system nitrate/nitrite sensor histidine kinase NarX